MSTATAPIPARPATVWSAGRVIAVVAGTLCLVLMGSGAALIVLAARTGGSDTDADDFWHVLTSW